MFGGKALKLCFLMVVFIEIMIGEKVFYKVHCQ